MAAVKTKKQRGERPDAWLATDVPGMNLIMPHIMPNRTDNEAYINVNADLRPLDAYLAKLNAGRTEDKYTYFHLVSAAIGKTFILRPKMNRFISNNRLYQRKKVSIAFVVKKKFEDNSEEGLAFLDYGPSTTLEEYHEALMKVIHATRRTDTKDTSSDAMDIVSRLPQFLIRLIVWFTVQLDKHGRAPRSLVGTDPYHASVLLSNLGSIGLQCGYHHLANWGTNSCFVVVGKKHMTMTYDRDGSGDLHEVLPLGFTLDERLADGYYYSRTVKLLEYLLAHPEELEKPAETPVEF